VEREKLVSDGGGGKMEREFRRWMFEIARVT
jgi:hypothetical protein